jgi:hypothetical protein
MLRISPLFLKKTFPIFSLDVNYNLLANRLGEQQTGLNTLEQECLEKSESRRAIESEMNKLKPDLWELQHKKEKYMQ